MTHSKSCPSIVLYVRSWGFTSQSHLAKWFWDCNPKLDFVAICGSRRFCGSAQKTCGLHSDTQAKSQWIQEPKDWNSEIKDSWQAATRIAHFNVHPRTAVWLSLQRVVYCRPPSDKSSSSSKQAPAVAAVQVSLIGSRTALKQPSFSSLAFPLARRIYKIWTTSFSSKSYFKRLTWNVFSPNY